MSAQFTYGFCHVPGRGFWVNGWGDNAEFTAYIEYATMYTLDSPSLAKAIKDFGGNLKKLSFNESMQTFCN